MKKSKKTTKKADPEPAEDKSPERYEKALSPEAPKSRHRDAEESRAEHPEKPKKAAAPAPKADEIDLLGLGDFSAPPVSTSTQQSKPAPVQASDNLLDMDFGGSPTTTVTSNVQAPVQQSNDYSNLMFFDAPTQSVVETPTVVPYEV